MCEVACPTIYEERLAPMLSVNGAERSEPVAGIDEAAAVALYRIHVDSTDLRAVIETYRQLMLGYVSKLGPVQFEYASSHGNTNGITFIEERRGLFQVDVALTCSASKITSWCREASKSDLVTDIHATQQEGRFVVTLVPHAHQLDRRPATYQALAAIYVALSGGHTPPK